MDSVSHAADFEWLRALSVENKKQHELHLPPWNTGPPRYMFPSNNASLGKNYEALQTLNESIVSCSATHSGTGSPGHSKDFCGGLIGEVPLALGAELMLTFNLWTDAGLANGSRGILIGIIFVHGMTGHDGLPLALILQLVPRSQFSPRHSSFNKDSAARLQVQIQREAGLAHSVSDHAGIREHNS